MDIPKTDKKLCVTNISGNNEDALITDLDSYAMWMNFSTNGKKIILGNMIFDIKSMESQIINEVKLDSLGVLDNYYYFYSPYDMKNGDKDGVMRMNLKDNLIEKLLDRYSFGKDQPRLYDNKVLFIDNIDESLALKYSYYDILKNEMVTVMDSADEQSRYIYDLWYASDHGERYDYMIYNNYFYVHYPQLMTRVNMDTKQEEVFTWLVPIAGQSGVVYLWQPYEEYAKNLENK